MSMGPSKLHRNRAVLVVVDVQEAFRKAIEEFDEVAGQAAKLARGAALMDVPVLITEQYPKGLGRTVKPVMEALPEGVQPLEKTRFSAVEARGFELSGRDQALVCGIEAHVCVSQTVIDLLGAGIETHVAADAVASRRERDREVGLARLSEAGGVITGVEASLFELLGGSDAEGFREVQALIK